MISNHQLNLSTKRTVHTSCLCKYASCARPTSSCRFYCLWKNSLLLINTKLQEKLCYYLLIKYIKNTPRKSRQKQFWKRVRAIFNLHSCYNFAPARVRTLHPSYNFALVLHDNAVVFSKSKTRIFFSCTLFKYLCITFDMKSDLKSKW